DGVLDAADGFRDALEVLGGDRACAATQQRRSFDQDLVERLLVRAADRRPLVRDFLDAHERRPRSVDRSRRSGVAALAAAVAVLQRDDLRARLRNVAMLAIAE